MRRSLICLGITAALIGLATAGRSTAQQPTSSPALAYRYVTTLGQTGLPWQRSNAYLNEPWGIVGDGDGVWVANAAGRNLVRFGSGTVEDLGRAGDVDALYGKPVRSIGDVAVWERLDPSGQPTGERRLWFTDPLGHVVVGLPLLGEGRTGPPTVLGTADEPGGNEDHFREPTGVAVSSAGVLFVADRGNHRVQIFGADGRLAATIGRSGQPGSGSGELNLPARLALSSDGFLVIADSGNHRVVAYDVSDPRRPREVRQYGSGARGSTDADFDTPLGVHVDAQFVYVADSGNSRVQVMGRQDGRLRRTLDGRATEACGAPGEHWEYPSDVTQDASGTVYIALPRRMTVVACSGPQWQPRPDLSRGAADTAYLTTGTLHNAPSGVAAGADGSLVIVEHEGQRVVRRAADGSTVWVAGRAGLAGRGSEADLRFAGPVDAAFLPDGRIVVSDAGNARLVVLNGDGSMSGVWGEGGLVRPAGLGVGPDGGLLVADAGAGRVRRFDRTGQSLGDLGAPGSPLSFREPVDAAVAADGGTYVSDRAEHAVFAVTAAGTVKAVLGERGVAGRDFGHFKWPIGLAVDAQGRLLVADSGNERIQVCDATGAYLTTIGGRRGVGSGGLREPRGIAVGLSGRLYVADTFNHRVQVLEPAADPWLPAAGNGFGSHLVSGVEALAELDGQLYAGLRSEAGAAVWRLGPSRAWEAVASGGWTDARNQAVGSLAVFGGRLYAGVENVVVTTDPATGAVRESSTGGSLYRTADGANWEPVVTGGFREARQSGIGPLVTFRGELYAATRSIDAASPPQLWRSPSGDAGSWQRVPLENSAGREWSKNGSISALAVYTGSLYVGSCGFDQAQLWAGAPGNWRAVGYLPPGGSTRDAVAQIGVAAPCVTALLEYEGHLYAALGVDPRFRHRVTGNRAAPTELWRCRKCDGSDWDMAAGLGFGDRSANGVLSLAAFDEPPFRFLYAFVPQPSEGLDVWRAEDGLDWQPLVGGGFGDDNNTEAGIAATAAHGGRLYVGTRNLAHGGELWSTAGTRPDVVPTPPGPTATPTPRPSPQPPTGRARFVRSDEWPDVEPAPEDVLNTPVDMAVAADGEVYVLDSRPVRVARLLPDRTWSRPFGGVGTGPDRLTEAPAIAVDDRTGRVYVSDVGTERLVAYDRAGLYQATVLDAVYAVDVVARADGTLWVADRMAGGIRRIAADGSELERFGEYAPTGDFGFATLVAVAEEPAGRLWVADQNGRRLRAYDRAPGGGWQRKRTVDLNAPQFQRQGCTGQRLQAIADGLLLAGACVLKDGAFFDGLPANHRGSDLYGVGLRTVGNATGQFFALATYDSDRVNPYNETYPAIVAYTDEGFDIVRGYWLGRWFRAGTAAETALIDPVRIDALANGEIFLVDGQAENPADGTSPPFVRRWSPDGRVLETLGVRTYPSRSYSLLLDPRLLVSTGEPGRLMGVGELRYGRPDDPRRLEVLAYGQSVRRRYCRAGVCSWGVYFEPIWSTTLVNLNQARGASDYNYAAAFDPVRRQYVLLQLWADGPSDMAMPARLLLFPVDRRGRRTEVALDGTERQALWTDVDVGPDGRIAVLDSLNDRVQVVAGDGQKLVAFETPKDAWKVAAGPNGEVFVLTNYGHVVRMAADGTFLSRFVGLPSAVAPHTAATDLAVDAWGHVYAVDNLYDTVLVFEPQGTEDDALQGARCSLAGDKWVAPEEILLGDTAHLELALFGSCGFVEEGADIVIAVNAAMGSETVNLRVARQVFAIVDLDVHRVGIVSFGTGAKIEKGLTTARSDIIRAFFDLTSVRVGRCGSNNEAALRAARDVFNASPSTRRKVVVLIDPGRESPPGSCPWSNESISRLARTLQADGVHIVAVNGPSFAATSEVHSDVTVEPRGQGTGRPAIRRALSRRWPDSTIRSGKLVDSLPANIDYVMGSAQPQATWDAASRSLSWDVGAVPLGEVARFSLTIRPRAEGLWPTNRQAVADLVDGWGGAHRVVLPIPKIRVYGERPTVTPTPSPTPMPTPTAEPAQPPAPLFLPIALRTEPCLPDSRNADVALLIDASVSMTEPIAQGGTKLDAAREAARVFLELLRRGRDQAAVIQFNATVAVLVPLTEDLAAVGAGLERLTVAAGTRLDLALDAGRAELTGPGRRPANNPVLILLTDGQPTGTTADEVRRAGQRCRDAGLLVFTVGLGDDVDKPLLESLASGPDWCYLAPDAARLAEIYRQIAYEIPCRPQWP